jgi:hypothetical protein
MPDWEVRRFRRTRIRYDDKAYFLARTTLLKKGLWRHVLEPWPEEPVDPPWIEITYGPAWIAERDAHEAAITARRRAIPFLWALWPFAGFLPSRAQAVLQDRYGINAHIAVERSLMIQYLVGAGLMALLMIATWTAIISARPLLVCIVALGVDALARRDALLREDPEPPGFYEWLWRLLPRPGRSKRR